MNLTKLFKAQRALDDRIIKEKGLEGQDLLPNLLLALQVELGELANEWRGFKHWSNDREPRNSDACPDCGGRGFWFSGERVWCSRCNRTGKVTSPMLVEYVDCLHFILSIGHQMNFTEVTLDLVPDKIPALSEFKDTTDCFIHVFNWIANVQVLKSQKCYVRMFATFLALGDMLGFSWEQIEAAYFEKNAVNHQRQESGY